MKPIKPSFSFTHKLVKVYTLIFAIPILLIVFIALAIFWTRQVRTLTQNTELHVAEYSKEITSNFDSMVLAENIFSSNHGLLLTFYYTGKNELPEIIDEIKNFADEIDHIKLVMPQIYSMRAFIKNETIPERWPVIFKEDRLSTVSLEKWNYNYVTDLMGNIESAKAPSVCLQTELQVAKKHVGYIQITMKMEDVFPFLYNTENSKSQMNFVLKNGMSLYSPSNQKKNSSQQQDYDLIAEKIWKKINKSITQCDKNNQENHIFSIIIGGKTYMGAWSKIPNQDLVVIQINSVTKITVTIILFFFACLAAIFLSMITMYLIIRFATGRVTEGLTQVIDGMNQVRKENYDIELKVETDDEIGQMAKTFTKMVKTIKEQIYRIETEQKLLTETEIKAMQNQINAHFLYNALETIKMQAELADEDSIVESITLLGKMMHYCLKWKNPKVSLKEEIEYIQCYVQLLNIRNDYFVNLEIDLPEEYENVNIMKMLLQPIVENAFYHGIEPRGTDSTIKLYTQADKENNILWICISDLGIGMTEDELASLLTHINDINGFEPSTRTSIGLKNIQERLYVFFGKNFGLKIESKKNEGTTVKVPIKLTD